MATKSILFVDDQIEILEFYKKVFSKADLNIFTAVSVDEAISTINNVKIDVICTDINMSEKTGYDLIDWIEKNKKIDVLIVSNESSLKNKYRKYESIDKLTDFQKNLSDKLDVILKK